MKNQIPALISRSFILLATLLNSLLLLPEAMALDPKKRITQYDIRVYKARDGLPMNALKDVFQSSDGYIWIASQEGGVSRFDGKEFINYTTKDSLTSNVVTQILVNRKKKLIWFATDNGVSCYKDNRFVQYTLEDGLTHRRAKVILESNREELLVINPVELNIISGDSTYGIAYPPNLAGSMFLRPSGEILFGGIGGELYGFGNNRFYRFSPPGLPSVAKITAIHEDRDGNLSHEFRTPLTLILGPLRRLREGISSGDVKRQYGLMERNAQRLLRLINQLLDLSKLDAGKLKLAASESDVIHFLKGVLSAFESLARERKITLDFEWPGYGAGSSSVMAYFDREKLEKIMINLIANAFKFTPEGGRITVLLSKDFGGSDSADHLHISVKDTGTGIPAEHLPYVFDQFYQVGTSEKEGDVGSGIGLALTKELVELHRGTIAVRSEIDSGTEFLISLPLGKNHLNPDEIVEYAEPDPGSDGAVQKHVVEAEFGNGKLRADAEGEFNSDTELMVLVVDDNEDMRDYLRDVLIGNYQVIEASDGEAGLQKALAVLPDIIVSDVMMPKIDGYEFCQQLKSNELTSHIPIILLTAKSSDKSKIEGLETGADAYLTKPFSHEELSVRLRKLIEQRQKLQEKFRKQITVVKVEPEKIDLPSRDQEFLDRAKAVVEKNMADPDFSAEKFAADMHMSKGDLNRKLKALTGEHTSNFVLLMRLQRAAQMLEANSDNISQVAYSAGFNNLSHFNREFKKQFAATPSVYREQHSKTPL